MIRADSTTVSPSSNVLVAHLLRFVQRNQQAIRNVEITKTVGNLNVLLHRASQHANPAVKLLCNVENDLQTMNRRRESGYNYSTLSFRKDFFKGRDDSAFGWSAARHSCVR
jgi:hypothetical protein